MIELKWSDFKNFSTSRAVTGHYFTIGDNYQLFCIDSPIQVSCIIPTDPTNADTIDFETNFKSSWNKKNSDSDGYQITRQRAFSNSDGFRFRGASFSGTATAGTVTNIDYKLTEERYINGGQLILKDHVTGDKFTFQVIDIDNVMGYGANVVLDQFITDFYVSGQAETQAGLNLAYPAKIPANLYLRLKITSTGETNIAVRCNLFLHKK
jgi:hypothetical protein